MSGPFRIFFPHCLFCPWFGYNLSVWLHDELFCPIEWQTNWCLKNVTFGFFLLSRYFRCRWWRIFFLDFFNWTKSIVWDDKRAKKKVNESKTNWERNECFVESMWHSAVKAASQSRDCIMQQLLYHTSFEQNEVANSASIDRNKPQKSSASSRYQQHRQKRRRQQRHQPSSAHRPHHQHNQQKTRQPKNHHQAPQHEPSSSVAAASAAAATLRYSRKPNQSNFKQKRVSERYAKCTRSTAQEFIATVAPRVAFISPKIYQCG